uniref:Uncharacterized protein n=1 Tax=Anguilla anguilla TaxID=7936 RepID=A0A0E9Q2I2_ANGAN
MNFILRLHADCKGLRLNIKVFHVISLCPQKMGKKGEKMSSSLSKPCRLVLLVINPTPLIVCNLLVCSNLSSIKRKQIGLELQEFFFFKIQLPFSK